VAGLAAALGLGALVTAGSALAGTTPGQQAANYLGYTFTVPDTWQVVDLAKHPGTCVRFDRHVLYLGQPDGQATCPTHPGRVVDSVLVQPSTDPTAPTGLVDNAIARTITVAAKGVSATARYESDPAAVRGILASAGLPATAPASRSATPPVSGAATAAAVGTGASSYQGYGFDACTAPSAGQMNAWLSSPYRAIGIYIGGAGRGCAQPNLTASWVANEAASGWHFMPLYFGPQVAFGGITAPTSQGTSAADDAVNQAAALGFGPGTPLYYDMEGYSSGTSTALAFEAAWTRELHARGYRSGYYSSSGSGIRDLVANYNQYPMPDIISVAHYDGVATTADSAVPSNLWANHQRNRQYVGNVYETHGGVQIQIDRDFLDVGTGGPTGGGNRAASPSDVSGDGRADLLGVKPDGSLWYYVNGGGTAPFGNGSQIGAGFNVFNRILAADISGDGAADLVATKPDGTLWYYPNNSGSNAGHLPFTSGTQIGAGFDVFATVQAMDISGDGAADLVGVKPDGSLWHYVNGRGSAPYGNGTQIGAGFNVFSQLI
jgi:hypothetical protein